MTRHVHVCSNSVIRRLSQILNVPSDVAVKAEEIYRKSKGTGRNNEILAAASLYVAIRTSTCRPISLKKLCRAFEHLYDDNWNMRRNVRKRVYKLYRKIMLQLSPQKVRMCSFDPTIYALDAARTLQLNRETRHTIEKLCKTVVERKLHVGLSPVSVAGAVCYIACVIHGEDISQWEIARALNITEVTVRNVYRTLARKLDYDPVWSKLIVPIYFQMKRAPIPRRLFKQLFMKILKREKEISIFEVGKTLHHLYPEETKGYYVYIEKISKYLEELEKEKLVTLTRYKHTGKIRRITLRG